MVKSRSCALQPLSSHFLINWKWAIKWCWINGYWSVVAVLMDRGKRQKWVVAGRKARKQLLRPRLLCLWKDVKTGKQTLVTFLSICKCRLLKGRSNFFGIWSMAIICVSVNLVQLFCFDAITIKYKREGYSKSMHLNLGHLITT